MAYLKMLCSILMHRSNESATLWSHRATKYPEPPAKVREKKLFNNPIDPLAPKKTLRWELRHRTEKRTASIHQIRRQNRAATRRTHHKFSNRRARPGTSDPRQLAGFSTLFFETSDEDEIAWSELLHAVTSAGFAIKEMWHFALIEDNSQESYPVAEIPFWDYVRMGAASGADFWLD